MNTADIRPIVKREVTTSNYKGPCGCKTIKCEFRNKKIIKEEIEEDEEAEYVNYHTTVKEYYYENYFNLYGNNIKVKFNKNADRDYIESVRCIYDNNYYYYNKEYKEDNAFDKLEYADYDEDGDIEMANVIYHKYVGIMDKYNDKELLKKIIKLTKEETLYYTCDRFWEYCTDGDIVDLAIENNVPLEKLEPIWYYTDNLETIKKVAHLYKMNNDMIKHYSINWTKIINKDLIKDYISLTIPTALDYNIILKYVSDEKIKELIELGFSISAPFLNRIQIEKIVKTECDINEINYKDDYDLYFEGLKNDKNEFDCTVFRNNHSDDFILKCYKYLSDKGHLGTYVERHYHYTPFWKFNNNIDLIKKIDELYGFNAFAISCNAFWHHTSNEEMIKYLFEKYGYKKFVYIRKTFNRGGRKRPGNYNFKFSFSGRSQEFIDFFIEKFGSLEE